MTAFLFRMLPDIYPTRTKHSLGLPPELTGGVDLRQELGRPRLLIISERPDGIFLFRYDAEGNGVGDTWHPTIDEAQEQATYEYNISSSGWRDARTDNVDFVPFERIKKALDQ